MKLIVAYIQPEKLNDVKKELYKADIRKSIHGEDNHLPFDI